MKKSLVLTAIAVAFLSTVFFTNVSFAENHLNNPSLWSVLNGWAVTDNVSNSAACVFTYGLTMDAQGDYIGGKLQFSTQDGANFNNGLLTMSGTTLQSATTTTLDLSGLQRGTYYWRIALLDGTDITTGSYGSFTL